MGKVKKATKVVVKSPTQKVKKINQKPLKKPKKSIEKELNAKVTKALNKSNEEDNLPSVDNNKLAINYDKLNIDVKQIQKGVEALLQYTEKHKSKDLFKGQQQIFAQITCVRIPTGANRKLRIKLQHPLITIDNEICLIVPDLQRGRKVDHEETIEHYEELLRSKNVTYIKRILPIRQLRVEYDQFELKRRLCGYYDYFLVDGRISGHVLHILGKTFNEKRKQPVPIQINSGDLNKIILTAMSKTEINIHSKGDTYIVQIGHTDMPVEHIVDNLKEIIKSTVGSFPGSWDNVRALHVKTEKSVAIPVYYTMKDVNKVVPPKVKASKSGEIITDELSTTNYTVSVHPDGRVILNNPVSLKRRKALIEKKKLARKSKTLKKSKNGTPQKSKNGTPQKPKINKMKEKRTKKKLLKKSAAKKSPTKVKAEANEKVKQSPKKMKSEKKGDVKTKPKSAVKVKKATVSSKKIKKVKQD